MKTRFRTSIRHLAVGAGIALLAACSGQGTAPVRSAADPPDIERLPPQTNSSSPETTRTADIPVPAPVERASDHLYDQTLLHEFALTLTPDDLAQLDADPVAEEYVEGFLDFEGERYGPIGVRYKGSFGSFVGCVEGFESGVLAGPKTCTKLSLKLKFDGRYDVDFFDVDKVQLHAQNLDPTMMHERLGYHLFREFGVPAPRSTHARVTMNGEFLGLFALTEQVDERFLATVFDDPSGNLVKEKWPIAIDGRASEEARFRDGLRTNEDAPKSFESLTELALAVVNAPPGERLDVVDPYVDVDAWMRYWVVDRAIGHDDGPLRFDCTGDTCRNSNFYLYQDPSNDEVEIIAWDLNVAFEALATDSARSARFVLMLADDWGGVTNGCESFEFGPARLAQRSGACDPLVAAFVEDTETYDRLRSEFLSGPYRADAVDELLATWSAQVEGAVAEAARVDPRALSVEAWRDEVDALRSDIDAERSR